MTYKSWLDNVAPYGMTTEFSRRRLDDPHVNDSDPERIMMRLWEKENTRVPNINYGGVPIDNILHRCTDDCKHRHAIGINHPQSEIEIAASAVQWLASPIGRTFLEKFFEQVGCRVVYDPDAAHKWREQKKRNTRGGDDVI